MERQRDARGRFVKRQPSEEEYSEKELVREYNSIADGGEPTEQQEHRHDIFVDFIQNALGIIVALFILMLILTAFCGCSAKEKTVYVPVVKRVEVQTIVRDTVIETELVEYYSERETRDTASYLTNPFAFSQATVTNGTLTHSLGIHPDATVKQKLPVTERIVTIVDSIPYPVPVPGPTEYIEHEPSPIECTLIRIGAIAIIAATAWAVANIKKFID